MGYTIESRYNAKVWVDMNGIPAGRYDESFPTPPLGYKSPDDAFAAVKAVFQSAVEKDLWIGFDIIRMDKRVYARPDNYSWRPDVVDAKYRFEPLRSEDKADDKVVVIDRGFGIIPRIAKERPAQYA